MPLHPRAALSALGALLVLGACGGGEQSTADSVDPSVPGAPVGSYQDAADSALRAGSNTIDSLKQAGQTPMSGLDSAAAAASRNAQDTTGRGAAGATPAPAAPRRP